MSEGNGELLAASKLGRFILAMQVSWRPVFAYQTIVECTVMSLLTAHAILTHDLSILDKLLQFQGVFISYWSLKFGVLGVYSWGRTKEKITVEEVRPAGSFLLGAQQEDHSR